jgi:hypothetical protein
MTPNARTSQGSDGEIRREHDRAAGDEAVKNLVRFLSAFGYK